MNNNSNTSSFLSCYEPICVRERKLDDIKSKINILRAVRGLSIPIGMVASYKIIDQALKLSSLMEEKHLSQATKNEIYLTIALIIDIYAVYSSSKMIKNKEAAYKRAACVKRVKDAIGKDYEELNFYSDQQYDLEKQFINNRRDDKVFCQSLSDEETEIKEYIYRSKKM
jgi:hypothetical protein